MKIKSTTEMFQFFPVLQEKFEKDKKNDVF